MATAGKGTLFVYLQAAPPRGRLAGFYVWGAARRGSAPGPRWGLHAGGCPPPLGGAVRGAARPPRSSQRSLRVAAKAASFNSLAHWASASLLPPLAALGSAPLPLLKKAGENLLEDGLGFATECAGPPLMGSGGLRLSKKWLAPLFRGFHSSLAPTARPGSYARKPLLRKAFCGFDAHVAKSDYSLRGLRPPSPQGFLDKLGPPLMGSGGLVLFGERRGGKGWWMDRLDGGKFQRLGGGGGRAQRAQNRGGGPWPPPLLWFCGPFRPTKRRRPPA